MSTQTTLHIAPDDERMRPPQAPHFLKVHPFDSDDPADAFELRHHPECPAYGEYRMGEWTITGYRCDVGGIECVDGLEKHFVHHDDPAAAGDRERLASGIYLIQAWSEKRPANQHWDEVFRGLRIIGQIQLSPAEE